MPNLAQLDAAPSEMEMTSGQDSVASRVVAIGLIPYLPRDEAKAIEALDYARQLISQGALAATRVAACQLLSQLPSDETAALEILAYARLFVTECLYKTMA